MVNLNNQTSYFVYGRRAKTISHGSSWWSDKKPGMSWYCEIVEIICVYCFGEMSSWDGLDTVKTYYWLTLW